MQVYGAKISHIRWMIKRDLPEVVAIEQESFSNSWCEEDFIRCLRRRNCIGMVAEHEGVIAGFMVYELHQRYIHLMRFAVAKRFRRVGIGKEMIDALKKKLSSQRRFRIILEVRETNLSAQLFYKANGFRATAVMRGYYPDTAEDAYTMTHRYKPDKTT